ncbi:MAG TPA: putative zinc-binding metallopeptidase [Steroidobacteraceae bacterium]|nr:putative zinc-binding metallopeptidase [Steroidobacteraceae bacterium]
MKRRARAWARLDDEALLDVRLCDLHLGLTGTPVQGRITQLYRELRARGIAFRPHAWLAVDWFSPDGVPGFAVPFYLAHPRLTRLERRMTGEAEGGNGNWQMRILRHEAGHAIDSAYRLRRRARWRALFGPASRRYGAQYRVRPASRHHVQHLGEWYAQAHPTEDFAETFAVWLQPRSAWRRRYALWPARRKLEYVAQLAAEIGRRAPPVSGRERIEALEDSTVTLREHYRRKRAAQHRRQGRLADVWLRKVFASAAGARDAAPPAAALLRAHRRSFRATLQQRAGADRYSAQQIVRLAIERCRQLGLRLRGGRRSTVPKLRAALVRMARGYIASDALRMRL